MPDFDVFSLSDIKKKRKRRFRGASNGNFKRKHDCTKSVRIKQNFQFGRHNMLSKLSSLSISSLRKPDEEANQFYDRKHDLYEAALLTRRYTQHALRPYIDSEINHTRHFIKIPF